MKADGLRWRLTAMLVFGLIVNVDRVKASEEVLRKMGKTFFKVIEECKQELSISNDVIDSLIKFWSENSEHAERELGCVILCMAQKQELINSDQYRLHHDNAFQFAKNHGADDDTAKQIVTLFHECEEKLWNDQDHCARVMDVSRCFRDHMHRLKWAPTVEVLVTEILEIA